MGMKIAFHQLRGDNRRQQAADGQEQEQQQVAEQAFARAEPGGFAALGLGGWVSHFGWRMIRVSRPFSRVSVVTNYSSIL